MHTLQFYCHATTVSADLFFLLFSLEACTPHYMYTPLSSKLRRCRSIPPFPRFPFLISHFPFLLLEWPLLIVSESDLWRSGSETRYTNLWPCFVQGRLCHAIRQRAATCTQMWSSAAELNEEGSRRISCYPSTSIRSRMPEATGLIVAVVLTAFLLGC